MPPKRKATRRQREDPSSSTRQPHHVMTQPVFLQKILPFAANHQYSAATFKSVSSSWLETQIHYSGEILCWKAFYEASDINKCVALKLLSRCHDANLNHLVVYDYLKKVAERIFEMGTLLSTSDFSFFANSKHFEAASTTFWLGTDRAFELVINTIEKHFGIVGLQEMFDGSADFYQMMFSMCVSFRRFRLMVDSLRKLDHRVYFDCYFGVRKNSASEPVLCEKLPYSVLWLESMTSILRKCKYVGASFLKRQLQLRTEDGESLLKAALHERQHESPRSLYQALVDTGLLEEQYAELDEKDRWRLHTYHGISEPEHCCSSITNSADTTADDIFHRFLMSEDEEDAKDDCEELRLELASNQRFCDELLGDEAGRRNALSTALEFCQFLPVVKYLFQLSAEKFGVDGLKSALDDCEVLGACCINPEAAMADTKKALIFLCSKLVELGLFEQQVLKLSWYNANRLYKATVRDDVMYKKLVDDILDRKEAEEIAAEEAQLKREREEQHAAAKQETVNQQKKAIKQKTTTKKQQTSKKTIASKKVAPKKSAGKNAAPKKQVDKKQKPIAKKANKKK